MDHSNSKKLAGKYYEGSMKNSDDEVAKGLSMTHELVTDYYMGGTVDQLMGKDKDSLPQDEL